VLALKVVSPWYVAVKGQLPTGSGRLPGMGVVTEAEPVASRVRVMIAPWQKLRITVPLGTAELGEIGATWTVKMVGWP
jgi:hypothetical protein